MSMKLLIESWRKFVTEEETTEQTQTNYQKALEYLKNQGFELVENPPSELRIKTDEPREEVKNKIEKDLQNLGFRFASEAEVGGKSSFGRFQILANKKDGGNAYVYVKPKSRTAARAGEEYENQTADKLQQILPAFEIKTAGFGAGTDLSIKGQNNQVLQIELKTASGADFGQFKLKYYPITKKWDTMKTTAFKANPDLFQGIFNDKIKPFLENKHFTISAQDPFHYFQSKEVDGQEGTETAIVGLLRSEEAPATKQRLQKELFSGKDSLYFDVDSDKIQKYYAKKGDSLLSIKNKGIFALTEEAAKQFGIPQLKTNIKSAKVRFRIKPYMGGSGYHTFNCALKIVIEKSTDNLEDPKFIQKIVDYLA